MNSITLLGNIGRDPEIRYAQSGTAIANLSLATNKKINGEKQTQWHRLVAFGKTAETLSKYAKKGDMIAVEGEIRYSDYEKDGQKVYVTDIVVNRFHFAGGKVERSGQPEPKNNEPDDVPF